MERLKAHAERDGGRYACPFLLRIEDGEAVLGHVVRGVVVSSGALSPESARELAAELTAFADAAAALENEGQS